MIVDELEKRKESQEVKVLATSINDVVKKIWDDAKHVAKTEMLNDIKLLSPYSINGVLSFGWDPEACSEKIVLSENNKRCFLSENGYCFHTVVGATEIMGGIAYWEIHIDSRTDNELKVGVVGRKPFDYTRVRVGREVGIQRL